MISIKLTLAFAFIASVSAGPVSYVKRSDDHDLAIVYGSGIKADAWNGDAKDYYHHPSYKFEYGVNDPHTHDHKSQWEIRDGDVVKGEYTLDEADGTKRVVKYHADGHSGFHATVERIGHAHHDLYKGYEGYGYGY